MDDLFGPPISVYTRAQAIEDGILFEAPTDITKEAGFRVPVCLTNTLTTRLEVPEHLQGAQDFTGRLWDVLWMAFLAIKGSRPGVNPIPFKVIVASNITGRPEYLRLLIGFDGEAMTISFPEDG